MACSGCAERREWIKNGRKLHMNEQQVNELITALREQTEAQRAQTDAINRLAESNMALCDVIIQSLAEDNGDEITSLSDLKPQYLSQKARGRMQAGKLRHRVTIQEPVMVQNPETGAVNKTWQDIATVWAEVSPLSAREFIAAQASQGKSPPVSQYAFDRELPG